ncbi:S-adenosyl-L-methionine-dependent methyltransferase [Aspergillus japonicus CBS 114.51]|uniref:S-adenosyl-L-methionine-dependent methyltransferase n=1 Tax=Aspergillus japonicus CBS 114.51 TaxID=1448312 RepID=A0A8T8WWQ4_ASPJA|nr:S-adenosyl-L-methionine-dependent methyltransferase [Aspergillus japonicus CBS 114.51]RAH79729.1 S-adenosyl-L-methionine-dependent methyltransferase [Aspergillus japonicus CBS 114.51]
MPHKNGTLNKQTADVAQLAISPNLPAPIPWLLDQIHAQGKEYLDVNPQTRLDLLESARSLVYALETPREAILRHCWSETTSYAAIETGINVGIFTALGTDDSPKTVAQLAKTTNVDPVLLVCTPGRMMKHLAAMGVLLETGKGTYQATGFSKTLTEEKYSDAFPLMTTRFTQGFLALPTFLAQTNHTNPTNPKHTAFHLGHNTTHSFFEHVQREPDTARRFNNHMGVYAQGRPRWMDPGFYPVQQQLVDGAVPAIDDEGVLLVDVGGSFGHDLLAFRRKWPDLPGRLVLQDLPEVVACVPAEVAELGVEVLGYDFFTPQTVVGARAYYLHSILHDWPDDLCRMILANLKAAMTPGYSKLLINENVIPDTGAYWETTSLDFIMMSIGSGERTESQWRALLEGAGLRVVRIWAAQRGVESLIGCELV